MTSSDNSSAAEIDSPLTVDVAELRRAIGIVLDDIEATVGSRVELPSDFFWTVLAPEKFDFDGTPEPTIGSLADDLNWVRDLRAGDRTEVLAYQAVWLGELLTALGQDSRK